MPIVKYGPKQRAGFELVPDDHLLAVRTRSQQSLLAARSVPDPIEAQLDNCVLVCAFADAGVEVYRAPSDESSSVMEARKQALRAHPNVRFAGSVLVVPKSREPVLYTENLFIKFFDEVAPDAAERVIRESGLTLKQKLAFSINGYFAEAIEGIGQRVFDLALNLLDRPDVEYCHPELIRPRMPKLFFPGQWHLAATRVDGVMINAHAHVDSAHQLSMGEGVTIAIIDDGVDVDHLEFHHPDKIVAPLDVRSGVLDARPRLPRDNHGTPCAGVACAEGVGGAAGVAPRARLMPIRVSGGLGSMAESIAFQWAADHGADVISCSWGPEDGSWYDPLDPRHDWKSELPAHTREAIDYAVGSGRAGRGCVILFAAGNGNESVENDGYASYDRVIAVAACNDQGKRSVYSDFGPSIWCCFPSGDEEFAKEGHPPPLTPGIWTTDRTGIDGYNGGSLDFGDALGHYTKRFTGTSSSCPGVAGVVALMLAVNPDLTWTQVGDRLRDSCDKIDLSGAEYDEKGHSVKYGYGRVNARRAVELARSARVPRLEALRWFFTPIPDVGSAEVRLAIGDSGPIANLDVTIKIEHSHVGDLVVRLIPPHAPDRPVVLHLREGGARRGLDRTYRGTVHPGLSRLVGTDCHGIWVLQVEDQSIRDTGTIELFGLNIELDVTATSASRRGSPARATTPTGRRATTTAKAPNARKPATRKKRAAKRKRRKS